LDKTTLVGVQYSDKLSFKAQTIETQIDRVYDIHTKLKIQCTIHNNKVVISFIITVE
jgi:hypothetical protein